MSDRQSRQYVVCIRNAGWEDLELRKLYQVQPDETAAKDNYVRVIDESGEDYLYPASCFQPVSLSKEALRQLEALPAPA